MRFILILLCISLLSCATQKRCLWKYPPENRVDTVFTETVRDSIVYRDSIVPVSIPGETIRDTLYIPVTSLQGEVHTDTLVLETEYARAEAYYKTPSIHLTLTQKDIFFQLKLDSVIKESFQWKTKYQEIKEQKVFREKYIPAIYKISLWMWIGVIILTIFILVFRKQVFHLSCLLAGLKIRYFLKYQAGSFSLLKTSQTRLTGEVREDHFISFNIYIQVEI